MRGKLKSTIFMGILFLVSIGNILTPVRVFSSKENRYLQSLPEINWDMIISGKFSKDFEKYTTDQFIGRNTWISLKTISDLVMLKKDNGRVYFGKDDYLFDVDKSLDVDQYNKNINYINSFIKNIRQYNKNINITALLIPSKSQVLSNKLPSYAPIVNEREIVDRLQSTLNDINIIDMIKALRDNSDKYIYYKTDHHWTTLGGYYGYEYYLKSIGITPISKDEFTKIDVSNDFLGSNYRKANFYMGKPDQISILELKDKVEYKITINNETILDSLYDESFLTKHDKYSYFLGGDKPLIEINTSVQNGKSILIIKDSFANSFIPFLINHYENIYAIDPRYFNMSIEEFVKDRNIDEVLFLFNIQNFVQEKALSILNK